MKMSDKEEESPTTTATTKRAHESDNPAENQANEDDESNDGWVGPLPTDAAPTKKRKGILHFFYNFYIFKKNDSIECYAFL